jgi:hypothetical protein
MPQHLQIGDRVRIIVAFRDVELGTLGTIVRIWGLLIVIYDVQFDRHPTVESVSRGVLAPMPAEPDYDTG